MEQIFLSLISESWIIASLFAVIVLSFIWKWVPTVYKKFDEMEQRHREETKELHNEFQRNFHKQRETFEKTMQSVVVTFNAQIERSNDWHEKHSNGINEIKILLNKNK